MNQRKALVVLSGGQDSTYCLFWAKRAYPEVVALTIDYGQRHCAEIAAARIVAKRAGIPEHLHEVLDVGDILGGASPLTAKQEPLEQYKDFATMAQVIGDRVELTWVPMRNALFLVLAANRAVVHDAGKIVIGVCQEDNANYPDCRTRFIESMNTTINQALGSDRGVNLVTPVITIPKWEAIKRATHIPGCYEAFAWTHTAYDGVYPPTGNDHASVLRRESFRLAGLPDPLVLRAWHEGAMALPTTDNYAMMSKPNYADVDPVINAMTAIEENCQS